MKSKFWLILAVSIVAAMMLFATVACDEGDDDDDDTNPPIDDDDDDDCTDNSPPGILEFRFWINDTETTTTPLVIDTDDAFDFGTVYADLECNLVDGQIWVQLDGGDWSTIALTAEDVADGFPCVDDFVKLYIGDDAGPSGLAVGDHAVNVQLEDNCGAISDPDNFAFEVIEPVAK
ncbi:MAG: hypothetical protein P9M14_05315 [Candidatus Alcyoniella australis]|nr:hypothetical protein [Candidatus Alcyoniella australis]